MIDVVNILITPGDGGSGSISFRREKFAPRGGPDGGDGGRGGDVILKAVDNTHLLKHLQYRKTFVGENGGDGSGNRRSGKDGRATFVEVPVGTIVNILQRNNEKTMVADLIEVGQEYVIGKGGSGGKGNSRYAGPQNREPLIAETGYPTVSIRVELEVQLIADVAVIGVPNAGKSSLLASLTGANPDVADYPFTTIDPVLGVVKRKSKDIVIVEIPGLIENAHRGVGLGDEFLRHAQRTGMTLHLLNGLSEDILADYKQTKQEMKLYDRKLIEKPEVVAITKVDLPQVKEILQETVSKLASEGIYAIGISSMSGEGTKELVVTLEDNLANKDIQKRNVGSESVPKIPIIIAEPKTGRVVVESDGNVLTVKSGGAERLVNRIDLEDARVRVQLIRELDRMGILKALEKAGVKTGSLVKIGNHELLWQ